MLKFIIIYFIFLTNLYSAINFEGTKIYNQMYIGSAGTQEYDKQTIKCYINTFLNKMYQNGYIDKNANSIKKLEDGELYINFTLTSMDACNMDSSYIRAYLNR